MTDYEYIMLSISLMRKGTTFQRRCIDWYMNNLESNEQYLNEIKQFIDVQVRLGKIDMNKYE